MFRGQTVDDELLNWHQVDGVYTISDSYLDEYDRYRYAIELNGEKIIYDFTSTDKARYALNNFEYEEYLETYNGQDIYTYLWYKNMGGDEWIGAESYKTLGRIFDTVESARAYLDGDPVILVEIYRDYYIYRWVDDWNQWNYVIRNGVWEDSQMLYMIRETAGYTEDEALQQCREEIDSYYEPPPVYLLEIESKPSNVSFTLNGTEYMTPYSDSLEERGYTIVFPESYDGKTFKEWNDGVTTPDRSFILNKDTFLSVAYEGEKPPPPPAENVVGPLGLWMYPYLNSEALGLGVNDQIKTFLLNMGFLKYEG